MTNVFIWITGVLGLWDVLLVGCEDWRGGDGGGVGGVMRGCVLGEVYIDSFLLRSFLFEKKINESTYSITWFWITKSLTGPMRTWVRASPPEMMNGGWILRLESPIHQ